MEEHKIYFEIFNNQVLKIGYEPRDNCVEYSYKNLDDLQLQLSKNDIDIEDNLLEIIDSGQAENNKESIKKFNIKHWVSNRSFGELIDMYENKEIILPDMQREFVWDSTKCSRLIESIILGLPIPPLFLLEIGNAEYELVDGFQRLTTLTNYIKGYPWTGKKKGKRNASARLSSKVFEEIQGKTFEQLPSEYQRILKRSTIPLIEFRQLDPDNFESKYLIFERINTGSEKLNPMQIRKSLAHGSLMNSLYKYAERCDKFKKLFSSSSLKKDEHVEALLRILVMVKIYQNEWVCNVEGINNILNKYCTDHRDEEINDEYYRLFEKSIDLLYEIFDNNCKYICRRVEINNDKSIKFSGNLSITILESMVGLMINNFGKLRSKDEIFERYCEKMISVIDDSVLGVKDNPYSTSTGSLKSIKDRFDLSKSILVKDNE